MAFLPFRVNSCAVRIKRKRVSMKKRWAIGFFLFVVAVIVIIFVTFLFLNLNRFALHRRAMCLPITGFLSTFNSDSTEGAIPPPTTDNWQDSYSTLVTADSWTTNDVIYPKQVIKIGQAYALLIQTRHNVDGDNVMTTSLAFANEITGPWIESSKNPIFDQVKYSWQGKRAMGEQLVYDEENNRWALAFIGDGGKDVPGQGIRAIGIAFSEDLKTWTIHPEPIVRVETADILDWAPGNPVERVYCHGLIHNNGWWYMIVNAGGQSKTGRQYKTGIIKSKSLLGPWEGIDANPVLEGTNGSWDEDTVNLMSPVRANGCWYASYNSLPGEPGRRTFGLAWTDELESKWSKTETFLQQLGDGPEAMMDRPVLFSYPGGWAVLAGKRISVGGTGELRLIRSNGDGHRAIDCEKRR